MERFKTNIEFKKDSKEIPLNFKIGNEFYPIGKIEEYKGSSISTSFEVTEEMLKGATQKLFISPVHTFREEVKTGLIKFLSCDGNGEKGFSFKGSAESAIVIDEIRRAFHVDLKVMKKKKIIITATKGVL